MTRIHAAISLFKHGPLLRHEFVSITGWSEGGCKHLLSKLVDVGILTRQKRGVYALAEGGVV